ncbi:cytochrome c oxidase assembly protein [Bremerella sp. P1]|uniref:cytochrome c oxidase assembly protein n=1 Tax=Bremerella sp. P1 TaxID=3026424 RepID=UPI0023681F39|nr:cytochrome c oxidase assembly protein [Bremerella sp. P1]WDI42088.1 cytochrome c oxidase assembly protein [Bremerella sp. P1]
MMSFLTNPSLWNLTSPVWLVVVPLVIAVIAWRKKLAGANWWWLAMAMVVLVLAFISPVGVLAGGYLFSAHMVQHLLLLLIVPLGLMLFLPREMMESLLARPGLTKLNSLLSIPVVGWIAGLGAMWLWHVPSLCSAATQSDALSFVRSATFLAAGLAFWWPIYSPVARFRLDPLLAVIYLFSACAGCTLLGIYITFTPVSVCPAFANPVDRVGILTSLYQAGFTPMVDQQLGGLLMWVPPCSLYVCAILSVLSRWYAMEDHASNENLSEASL